MPEAVDFHNQSPTRLGTPSEEAGLFACHLFRRASTAHRPAWSPNVEDDWPHRAGIASRADMSGWLRPSGAPGWLLLNWGGSSPTCFHPRKAPWDHKFHSKTKRLRSSVVLSGGIPGARVYLAFGYTRARVYPSIGYTRGPGKPKARVSYTPRWSVGGLVYGLGLILIN